jgi:acetyl-CoA/propionyl-CoA carboxylase carboxyl transferase subunit
VTATTLAASVAQRQLEDDAPVDPRHPEARLAALFDQYSMSALAGGDDAGVVTARGRANGVTVFAYCTDATKMGGAMGGEGCALIVKAIETAAREHAPVVGIWHSGGARLTEGVAALDAVGQVFAAIVRASGRVPQISVVLGPSAGGAAYGPALTDIVIMAPAGRMFVTGPDVVRSVTGQDVDMEQLGGPEPHARRSGVAHIIADSEAAALDRAGELAVLLGHRRLDGRARRDSAERPDPGSFLPAKANRAYNVKPIVAALLDGPEVELHPKWAPNIVTTLGRIEGRTVGVIANNPIRRGGCLDSLSAEKAARFVRMCDAFGVPLLVVVDVPGYLPGTDQEWDGVVRRGAKLLHAFADAVVLRVTLVTRKSYGGAYIAMNSRALGATAVLAWDTAEIAVMGAAAAVNILHRKRLAAAPPENRESLRATLIAQHEQAVGGVDRAVDIGVVDEIIEPAASRQRIAGIINAAPVGRGAHRNIPL